MFRLASLLRSDHRAVLPIQPSLPDGASALCRRKTAVSVSCAAGDGVSTVKAELRNPSSHLLRQVSSFSPMVQLAKGVVFRPSPELGLLSQVFVLSMAVGAIFTLAVISIPAMNAFRRLAASMDKLSKVASEEVPGTLSSLKLSGLEINDLTQQLSSLRQKISGNQYGTNGRRNKPNGKMSNPIVN